MVRKVLRPGFTTGSGAAAATKAAVLHYLTGERQTKVSLVTPSGIELSIPVSFIGAEGEEITYAVIKDGGDDPDITHGCEIRSTFKLAPGKEYTIKGGHGVGKVTKPGLAVSVGAAAINPVPRQMIRDVLAEHLPPDNGAEVIISIPRGEELALKTLNGHLGIVGGLSILGTTGIVYPMSEEAYKASLAPQLSVVKAQNYDYVILTPGRIGQRWAEKLGFSPEATALTSNYVGYMLEEALQQGFTKIILVGHPGKLAKLAAGVFHTHNRVGDGRLEVMAALAAVLGSSPSLVRAILDSTTTEGALELIKTWDKQEEFWQTLARRAIAKIERYLFQQGKIAIVLVDKDGGILAVADPKDILRSEGICHESFM